MDRRSSNSTGDRLARPQERRDLVFKFLVIGDYGVGKTAIVRRYTEGKFSSNYKITIGADFCVRSMMWDAKTRVSLQLWDIAGHERFSYMTRVYYKYADNLPQNECLGYMDANRPFKDDSAESIIARYLRLKEHICNECAYNPGKQEEGPTRAAHVFEFIGFCMCRVGCAVVFDVTRLSSFKSVSRWVNDLNNKMVLDDGSQVPIVLLANKWDIGESCVSDEAINKLCKELGIPTWFKTSAKYNLNIDEGISKLVLEAIKLTKGSEPPVRKLEGVVLDESKPTNGSLWDRDGCCS